MNVVDLRIRAQGLVLRMVLEEIRRTCNGQISYTDDAELTRDADWGNVRNEAVEALKEIRDMVSAALAYANVSDN